MEDPVSIANRHLLPAEGLAQELQRAAQFVRVVVADAWGRSVSGQLLASCLVNLLCRQVELVNHIEVVAVPTASLIRLPSGEAAEAFPDCLPDIAAWAVKDRVRVTLGRTPQRADHIVYVGEAPIADEPGHALCAIGEGWKAWIGTPGEAPRGVAQRSLNPLGPFLAAALAAGEVFKRTRGIRRGEFAAASGFSLWSGETAPSWETLIDGPEIAGKALAPFHMIGVGAVGNGLAYIIANAALISGYVVTVDDDTYDTTNLNRCFLAGWRDVEHPKVDAVSRALRLAGIDTYPFPGTIKDYLAGGRGGLRADVAREVDDLQFGTVVSCVDKGAPRQDVQGLAPKLLLGGSTLNLIARVNHYRDRAGAACLACHNPKEKDGEKIRILEQKLRAMPKVEMATFLRANGVDPAIIEEYLAQPRCGSMGEAALHDLATRGPAEFSVGFVSLGAALLLASALFRHLLFPESAPKRADMTSLSFLYVGLHDAGLAPDDACEWHCQERRRRHVAAPRVADAGDDDHHQHPSR